MTTRTGKSTANLSSYFVLVDQVWCSCTPPKRDACKTVDWTPQTANKVTFYSLYDEYLNHGGLIFVKHSQSYNQGCSQDFGNAEVMSSCPPFSEKFQPNTKIKPLKYQNYLHLLYFIYFFISQREGLNIVRKI